MLTSTNLCVIPFLGHCDNARLQMSAKQLAQSLTHLNCQVPKVMCHDYYYLSDSSRKYRYSAITNGNIIYTNDDIMIVQHITDSGHYVEVFDVPQIMQTSSLFATNLRYKRQVGPYLAGDTLFEYDCFHNNIPTYGYNLWTAYMSFFGLNHEDSVVLSESALRKMKSTKTETILIPIYEYSMFRQIYQNSAFKIIPEVGQKIKDTAVAYRNQIRPGNTTLTSLTNISVSELATLANDNQLFNSVPITSRIPNAVVFDIRVHTINNKIKLIDKNLQVYISRIAASAEAPIREAAQSLKNLLNRDFAKQVLATRYIMSNTPNSEIIDSNKIAYLLEIKLSADNESHLGDKFSNRYANKGVCSFILPDNLRPIVTRINQPIDFITGPITGVGRMNFGQFIEGYIAKAITNSEETMKLHEEKIPEELRKIAKISDVLKDDEYALKIRHLADQIESNHDLRRQFVNSINDVGLYFEAPSFANFKLKDLKDEIENQFNIQSEEEIHISKDCVEYVQDKLKIKLNVTIPEEGVYLKIFCAPIYTLKLKQEAYYRSSARDFGSYKSNNNQPVQGRSSDGFIGGSARLGQMEFDGLLAHATLKTMSELRSVKNDGRELKTDMTHQIISNGVYHMPQTKTAPNFTKTIIESYMNFLND